VEQKEKKKEKKRVFSFFSEVPLSNCGAEIFLL